MLPGAQGPVQCALAKGFRSLGVTLDPSASGLTGGSIRGCARRKPAGDAPEEQCARGRRVDARAATVTDRRRVRPHRLSRAPHQCLLIGRTRLLSRSLVMVIHASGLETATQGWLATMFWQTSYDRHRRGRRSCRRAPPRYRCPWLAGQACRVDARLVVCQPADGAKWTAASVARSKCLFCHSVSGRLGVSRAHSVHCVCPRTRHRHLLEAPTVVRPIPRERTGFLLK